LAGKVFLKREIFLKQTKKRFKEAKIDVFVSKSNFEKELMPILMKYLG
jgi:hypothetical protein